MRRAVPIVLEDESGAALVTLGPDATAVAAAGEQRARLNGTTRPQGVEDELVDVLAREGITLPSSRLSAAVHCLDQVRQGKSFPELRITVSNPAASRRPAPTNRRAGDELRFFEVERVYPDHYAAELYDRLIGIDKQKADLIADIRLLFQPQVAAEWSRRHHRVELPILRAANQRPPLIILAGDVGSGKTALAETVGEAVVRQGIAARVHLLKINTQVRGSGHVGEMTQLIARAFEEASARAASHPAEPTLLLIDEADALAASREMEQMHHEDRAGTNTLLQRLDNLKLERVPLAVLFITNRPNALDPAIRRRARLEIRFSRPDRNQRIEIFDRLLAGSGLGPAELERLGNLGSASGAMTCGYTASDIVERLLPLALRFAVDRDVPLSSSLIEEAALSVEATRPFDG